MVIIFCDAVTVTGFAMQYRSAILNKLDFILLIFWGASIKFVQHLFVFVFLLLSFIDNLVSKSKGGGM